MKLEKTVNTLVYISMGFLSLAVIYLSIRLFTWGLFYTAPQTKEQQFGECYERCLDKMREINPEYNSFEDTRCLQRCVHIYQQGETI
jgi:hypothetical protein